VSTFEVSSPKVARGMFQPVARHLRTDIAEDRLAEDIAMA